MIRKTDIIIISIIIVVSLLFSFILYLIPFEGEYFVTVYIDGDLVERLPLEGDYQQIDIETQYGTNLLIISEGNAFIYQSNCNTKSCISRGIINRPGAMIICAPHNLVVKIESFKEEK
ncbi:MAG: NusG domain II-containing protein [Clostridiales bacterium]|nr:NusG domain II-containing protein [Clostridiales bacterium]